MCSLKSTYLKCDSQPLLRQRDGSIINSRSGFVIAIFADLWRPCAWNRRSPCHIVSVSRDVLCMTAVCVLLTLCFLVFTAVLHCVLVLCCTVVCFVDVMCCGVAYSFAVL